MKPLSSLLLALGLALPAFGGEAYVSSKNTVTTPPPPVGCDCFNPGLSLGIFGAGILPDSDEDDALGGGVLLDYFFTEHIGLQGSYGIFATGSEHHEFDAALVVRFPITDICIAPYILGGAGYATNSEDNWNLFVGGGIEARIPDADCLGIFADGAYHWGEDDSGDFTIVRVGLKFKL
ncbi:outer membrane beta-barrel protein [Roseimicrobium sp. ORNL1]|uniref:outer membrane beta-barrel protein n=1 Tax=Roseimicrobium sp. ORNL1 TaxID=2711231 RepID=UPI0013E12FD6|nr:outer membrane beta-barrel protein [Roseimicrobium sp. ORNL1]QIF02877.1 porin family protein [Roseimicrobium sp. ORNL1]